MAMTFAGRSVFAASLFALSTTFAWAQSGTEYTPKVGQLGKDVVWVPTSQSVVDTMLDMAKLTKEDVLVDLGSGDGRTVITAAKRGSTARGIAYNPDLVELSRRNAEKEGVQDRATFEEADIFETDFSEANVLTLFLLPELNVRLRPTILGMQPGTRVVANSFTMDNWQPDETAQVTNDCSSYCHVYMWIVPARVEGSWTMGNRHLVLNQEFQNLTGSLHEDDNQIAISEGQLSGKQISFSVDGTRYEGEVEGSTMRGTLEGGQAWTATLKES